MNFTKFLLLQYPVTNRLLQEKKGMTKAMLDTEDINPTRAMTLYEKVGFKVTQEYITYKKHIAHAETQ